MKNTNLDVAANVAESLTLTTGLPKRFGRHWASRLGVQLIAILSGIAMLTPNLSLLACACSEVVVAQGNTTSSFSVDDQTAEFYLTQSDISLPGVVPVSLVRKYGSSNQGLSMFGFGWGVEEVSNIIEMGDSSAIQMGGRRIYFPADNNNYSVNNDYRLVFTGENEVTMENRRGAKWVYNTTNDTLKEAIDTSGNVTAYEWKVESVEYWNKTNAVYCPTKIIFPGNREMTFTYSTVEGREYLCTKATSPSGFDVEYEYTDGLLTSVSKSNGQVLDYTYHTVVHASNSAWVVGWLTKITYANGGEVEITYNGQYASPESALRVTKIEGPESYERNYEFEKLTSPDGRRLTVTDSLDHDTVYENYTDPRKTVRINALNDSVTNVLNENRLVTSATNARGYTTSYTYATSGTNQFTRNNLLTATNPLSKTWEYEYDSNNFLTKITDPLDHETELTNDSAGHVLSGTNALVQTVFINTYTSGTGAKGLLATTKNGLNNTTTVAYNSFGLPTKVTDPASKEWEFEYATDGSGNLTKFTNPLGKEWEGEYNGFYKVSKAIDPLNNETQFVYDSMANLTKVTDAESQETNMTYDKLQRATTIVNALSGTTSFTYNAESNLTKLTDALSREYTYTFDAVNQTKTFVFPGSSQESYDYDANSNLTKLTRRDGGEITMVYDDADRRTSKTWEDTVDTVFTSTYDNANRLTGIVKVSGTATLSSVDMGYNAANQIVTSTTESGTASYTYDAAQRLNQVTYPSAEVAKYAYTSRSQLESIKNGANGAIVDYTYDDAGRTNKKDLPNGLECLYEYNDANWVTKITLREAATPANIVQSFEYGYDKVGNHLWVKRKGGSGDVYQYDATYQLTGVKYGVSNPTAGYALATGASSTATYSYDAVGNRVQVVDSGTTNYTVNNLNQYTAVGAKSNWTYDTNGNLTGDGTWTYTYDREGHLVGASKTGTTITYKYDAVGRRMEKSVNSAVTKYVYSGVNLIEQRDGSNNVTAKYIYAGGIDNPVKVIKGANTYYYQQDALGSVTALVDGSGVIYESYTYDVFGQPTIKDGSGTTLTSPSQPFLFTGREFDAETELYHYRTRAYSAELGRFLQPDSIDFAGGDVNLYRYVFNNPTFFVDHFGLNAIENAIHEAGIRDRKASLSDIGPDGVFHEYCGLICKKCDSTFYETRVKGSGGSCFPQQAPCDPGDEVVAMHHSHPGGDITLSKKDKNLAEQGSFINPKTGEQVIPPNTPIGATANPGGHGDQTGIYSPGKLPAFSKVPR